MKLRILGLALGLAALAPITHATSLTIVNSDFETGGFATDDSFSNTPGAVPFGWTAVDGFINPAFFGYYNPNNGAYLGTTGGSAVAANMSGPNVFYFGTAVTGQGIQQTLADTFAANTDYSLTFALGSRLNNSAHTASLDVRLLAGSTVIASDTFRNATFDGTFANFSLNYTATAGHSALAGQALTIKFLENDANLPANPNYEVDIDNIRLNATPSASAVPEPSTYAAIFGVLALGAAAYRRRQNRA
jgi:hypothetical protein